MTEHTDATIHVGVPSSDVSSGSGIVASGRDLRQLHPRARATAQDRSSAPRS